MHLNFDGFSDEMIHVAGFSGKEFSVLATKTSYRTLSGINTPHIPYPVMLHPPAYEDGTDRVF